MQLEQFFKDFQDHLAPSLDTYEHAIYLYLFRHTRFVGLEETVIGFKSARRRMACGIGEKGKPMSENTAYEKLQSLQKKGCIVILDSTRKVGRFALCSHAKYRASWCPTSLLLPPISKLRIFFDVEENRERILMREGHRCFYCLRQLNGENYVIEHVVSRPTGDNSYRNVVAACRQCNNRKGSSDSEEWLRTLYRDGFLGAPEFQARVSHFERLRAGELKPPEMAG
ncbi:MAG: HNH endonuclease [Gemmatimonadaceae bacterium]